MIPIRARLHVLVTCGAKLDLVISQVFNHLILIPDSWTDGATLLAPTRLRVSLVPLGNWRNRTIRNHWKLAIKLSQKVLNLVTSILQPDIDTSPTVFISSKVRDDYVFWLTIVKGENQTTQVSVTLPH